MLKKISVDPLTRIEGHLKFETTIENGVIQDAKCTADMYRGIEKALIGYDARVAQQVTQRVCGVCPYAQAEASALALEDAMNLKLNKNGYLLRNLISGGYRLQDHILHFYTLSSLDFIDIAAVMEYKGKDDALLGLKKWVQTEVKSGKIFPAAPFLPRYKAAYASDEKLNFTVIKNYLDAIPAMADIQKMVAVFGGKAPHPVAIEAGGCTTRPTADRIAQYTGFLKKAKTFIKNAYFPDVIAVAKEFKDYFYIGQSEGNYLSFNFLPNENGKFEDFVAGSTIKGKYRSLDETAIAEDQRYAFYNGKDGVKPLQEDEIHPIDYEQFKKEVHSENGKYSWAKAPRYRDTVVEVGPVAVVINTYNGGKNKALNALVDKVNKELGITLKEYNSVMGRHVSRAIMSMLLVDRLEADLAKVEEGVLGFIEKEVPKNAKGVGMTEATRGALGHWIETDEKGLIKNYEMIVPTTWNISPKDSQERVGAVEQMLIGTKVKDPKNPMELARVVRSTDPCIACSVH